MLGAAPAPAWPTLLPEFAQPLSPPRRPKAPPPPPPPLAAGSSHPPPAFLWFLSPWISLWRAGETRGRRLEPSLRGELEEKADQGGCARSLARAAAAGGAGHRLLLSPSAARRGSGPPETSGDRERRDRFGEFCSLGCHKHTRDLSVGLVGRILEGRDFSSSVTLSRMSVERHVRRKIFPGKNHKDKTPKEEGKTRHAGAFHGFRGTVKLTLRTSGRAVSTAL